jgi:hypothetical protein
MTSKEQWVLVTLQPPTPHPAVMSGWLNLLKHKLYMHCMLGKLSAGLQAATSLGMLENGKIGNESW